MFVSLVNRRANAADYTQLLLRAGVLEVKTGENVFVSFTNGQLSV